VVLHVIPHLAGSTARHHVALQLGYDTTIILVVILAVHMVHAPPPQPGACSATDVLGLTRTIDATGNVPCLQVMVGHRISYCSVVDRNTTLTCVLVICSYCDCGF
jgi:hypothetical protein